MSMPLLPPPFRAMPPSGAAAREAGRAAAAAGIEEGALFWSDRDGRLDCAVVLRPDRPRRATLPALYVGALALADALAAFAPPAAPILFRWPDEILVDGGLAGRVSLDCAASAQDAVPAWAVLGFALALAYGGNEPGLTPDVTSLADEGFDGVSSTALIEGFARQLLRWTGCLGAEGLAPIAQAWWRRAAAVADASAIGLDAAGDLRLRRGGQERVLRLETALAGGGDG